MVKPVSLEPREECCPACGAGFRLADRRKRVQCPHCREIVEIAPPEKPAGRAAASASASAKELAEIKTRLARLDELEARTEALERKLAELTAASQPVVASAPPPAAKAAKPPEPVQKLIWHEPRLSEIAAAADGMAAAQHEALVANLAELGARRIVIQSAPEDGAAAVRAARFREIFEQATWQALPVVAAPERFCRWPLAVIAQAGSEAREMAELFAALAASGFKAVSLIDPSLGGCVPILCVGPQSQG